MHNNHPTTNPRFDSTQWSLVVAAGKQSSPESKQALAELCSRYWLPLYSHVRRLGKDANQASDLTQGFFAKLIEKNYVADADQRRGRFRTFLLTSLSNYMANEWDKTQAAKRGGGQTVLSLDFGIGEKRFLQEPASLETPEEQYERQWAITLLENVLTQLGTDYAERNNSEVFQQLRPFLTSHSSESYADVAERLDMTTGAVKVAVHRLRTKYREKLKEEIASTVVDHVDVDDEIRKLFATFSRKS